MRKTLLAAIKEGHPPCCDGCVEYSDNPTGERNSFTCLLKGNLDFLKGDYWEVPEPLGIIGRRNYGSTCEKFQKFLADRRKR